MTVHDEAIRHEEGFVDLHCPACLAEYHARIVDPLTVVQDDEPDREWSRWAALASIAAMAVLALIVAVAAYLGRNPR